MTDKSLLHHCERPPAGWRCNLAPGHDGPCPTYPDPFDFIDDRSRTQRVWDHLRGPWSSRRAWNLVCAALAAVPGVRRYVLSTTPLSAHPMFDTYKRAGRL
jgi:hypothetical protein